MKANEATFGIELETFVDETTAADVKALEHKRFADLNKRRVNRSVHRKSFQIGVCKLVSFYARLYDL